MIFNHTPPSSRLNFAWEIITIILLWLMVLKNKEYYNLMQLSLFVKIALRSGR